MNKWDITALKGVFLRTSSLEKFKDIVDRAHITLTVHEGIATRLGKLHHGSADAVHHFRIRFAFTQAVFGIVEVEGAGYLVINRAKHFLAESRDKLLIQHRLAILSARKFWRTNERHQFFPDALKIRFHYHDFLHK